MQEERGKLHNTQQQAFLPLRTVSPQAANQGFLIAGEADHTVRQQLGMVIPVLLIEDAEGVLHSGFAAQNIEGIQDVLPTVYRGIGKIVQQELGHGMIPNPGIGIECSHHIGEEGPFHGRLPSVCLRQGSEEGLIARYKAVSVGLFLREALIGDVEKRSEVIDTLEPADQGFRQRASRIRQHKDMPPLFDAFEPAAGLTTRPGDVQDIEGQKPDADEQIEVYQAFNQRKHPSRLLSTAPA